MKRSVTQDERQPNKIKAAKIQVARKSLLQKMQDLLERKPDSFDVTFCVGPEQKKVKAIKVLLQAASPVFEREFEEKWKDNLESGKAIHIPDFNAEAFQLFVKVTLNDTWDVEGLKDLNFQPDTIQKLISICRHYRMEYELGLLENLMKECYRLFEGNHGTEDFIELSRTNLLAILCSDSLPFRELDIFFRACKWAKSQCLKRNLKVTAGNFRRVLGDCLFEIRFPVMTNSEFTEVVKRCSILTPAEGFEIYKYIGTRESEKPSFDTSRLPFNTKLRTVFQIPDRRGKYEFLFKKEIGNGDPTRSRNSISFPVAQSAFLFNGYKIIADRDLEITSLIWN